MSNSEEYLDGLLQESINEKKREPEPELREPAEAERSAAEPAFAGGSMAAGPEDAESEDAFLHAFEEELLGGEDTDAFVRRFEQELEADETAVSEDQPAGDELFFENLDGILNDAREEMPDDDVMVDTIGDLSDFSMGTSEDGEPEDGDVMAM